jgi:2'-5' RNA ligase
MGGNRRGHRRQEANPMMKQIRTFVAIELDEALKAALRRVQKEFKSSSVAHIGRWISPDSIHLTLKFLGNVPVNQVEQIGQAISRACKSFVPFTISLAGLGCFPNPRRLRVIWVGVGGDLETLLQLQRSVESELNRLGFEPEKRGFTPHLTLARIRDRARRHEREEMGELISVAQIDAAVSMTVREVGLIRSDLRPSGAVYTRLAAISLDEK